MDMVFRLYNDKSWKTLLVEKDRLLLSTGSYSTPIEFLEAYNEEGIKKWLRTKKEILIPDITEMTLPHGSSKLKIKGMSHEMLEFGNAEEAEGVAEFVSKRRGFRPRVESMSLWSSIQSSVIGLVITFILGFVLYMDAKKIAEGGLVDTSGRRAWMNKLIVSIAEFLGVTGSIIVTVLCALVFFYLIWRKIQQPPNQVVYS